jgi:uncharacterized protein YciI
MRFIIHAVDRPGALETRLSNYDAHKSFLSDKTPYGVKTVMSGPLTSDDGQSPIGSFFLVEATDRVAVENFHRSDPFFAAGIWQLVSITGFLRRQG